MVASKSKILLLKSVDPFFHKARRWSRNSEQTLCHPHPKDIKPLRNPGWKSVPWPHRLYGPDGPI